MVGGWVGHRPRVSKWIINTQSDQDTDYSIARTLLGLCSGDYLVIVILIDLWNFTPD